MPESSATSKATKNLAAAADTSTEVQKTSAAAEKTTEKKTTAQAKKTSAAAAIDPSEFQNAQTTTEKATTSTHEATSPHSTPAATVSSRVPSSSSMVPIIMSTPSSSQATTTSASALPSATTANASTSSSPSVAGPVVGSIAGIAVVGAIAFFFIRRRNKNKKSRANHAFSQFLNEAPPHHGTGNARDSMWGMPAQAGEKDVNNGYAISPPPPPPEKAYNPDFGSPPPMSPPTAYSAHDPQHHAPPPSSPNGAGYGGQAPQAEYGNVSPSNMNHNAAIAGAAVAGAAVGGAMAHHYHQQQYPNEVNGDMPLAAPAEPMSPQSPQQQGASEQQNAYYQQQPSPQQQQQQHPELAGQQNAYYHQQQSPQQQHSDVGGQQNAYNSPPQEFQQQPGVGYNQPYPGYPQGYQQGYQPEAQQYYDPNSQQYGYSAQPYSQYNSMYIGAEHSYFQGDSEYTSNYPAVAAASAFGQSENAPEHQQQHSYEMVPQPAMAQPPTTADQAESVPTTSQPEQSRDVHSPNSTAGPNSVTPAPTLLTNDIGQSTPSTEHYVDHTTPAEQQPSQSEPAGNPYVLEVPIEYNNDPARETLYGLSEHYQYGGDDKDDGQELSSGHQNAQPPHPPAHKGDLM